VPSVLVARFPLSGARADAALTVRPPPMCKLPDSSVPHAYPVPSQCLRCLSCQPRARRVGWGGSLGSRWSRRRRGWEPRRRSGPRVTKGRSPLWARVVEDASSEQRRGSRQLSRVRGACPFAPPPPIVRVVGLTRPESGGRRARASDRSKRAANALFGSGAVRAEGGTENSVHLLYAAQLFAPELQAALVGGVGTPRAFCDPGARTAYTPRCTACNIVCCLFSLRSKELRAEKFLAQGRRMGGARMSCRQWRSVGARWTSKPSARCCAESCRARPA